MRTSDALDLEHGVFTKRSARAIARSLKRSAEHSRRRKSAPFRSAMSMLNFHINRGGNGLSRSRRKVLEAAKASSAAIDALTTRQAKAFEVGVPTAHVVRLPGADHYVYLSNEADVLREMKSFFSTLR